MEGKQRKNAESRTSIYQTSVVRTPYFSLTNIHELQNIEIFQVFCNNLAFQEAIYLASPILYQKCLELVSGNIKDKKEVERVTFSLAKYLLRMCSRPTPFGIFAGCSVASSSPQETNIQLVDENEYQRVVRLDMMLLCEITRNIELFPEARECLKYFPNSSLYVANGNYRYVEYSLINGARNYRTVEIKESKDVAKVLSVSQNGATLEQLIKEFTCEGIEYDEAKSFVHNLIDGQILVSELEPNVTGSDFFSRILSFLNSQNKSTLNRVKEVINNLRDCLSYVNKSRTSNFILHYEELTRHIRTLPFKVKSRHLLQVDLFKPTTNAAVNTTVAGELIEAARAVNKMSKTYQSPTLTRFLEVFLERYEFEELPLSKVLDPQIGIGYPIESVTDNLPLVNDIFPDAGTILKSAEQPTIVDSILFGKYISAIRCEQNEICIDEKDIEGVQSVTPAPCGVVMGEIVTTNSGDRLILITPGGGSSAANLITRFAHLHEDIARTAAAIAQEEQMAVSDGILFEIVHLPEARVGNILTRPSLRNLEFAYLAKNSDTKKVELNDIYISVRNGKISLRSAKLNCQLFPRLTTAHNYSSSKLPVYRFLCELQNQDRHVGVFRWPSLLNSQRFLPRVKFKNVIIELASWNFSQDDMTFLRMARLEDKIEQFAKWRVEWKIPRYFVLVEGDNELLFDAENNFLVSIFFAEIKKKNRILLKEFLGDFNASRVLDSGEKGYTNQFLFFYKNSTRRNQNNTHLLKPVTSGEIPRRYLPGSEWLYFKIYSDSKTSDVLLVKILAPCLKNLKEAGLIDKWFFIRFRDPEAHIRIRLHLTNTSHAGVILTTIQDILKPTADERIIWNIKLDTYSRELERYGTDTIDIAEDLFCVDSETAIELLKAQTNPQWNIKQWLLVIRSVHLYFADFSTNLEEEIRVLTRLRELFSNEFKLNKEKRIQLDLKYRKSRKLLEMVMSDDLSKMDSELAEGMRRLYERSNKMKSSISVLQEKVGTKRMEVLLESYLHMSINRMFRSKQRQHEFVIYDFLLKYLVSLKARTEKQAKNSNAVNS